jgi:hypothetical protein
MGQAYLNLTAVLQARPRFPKMLPGILGNALSGIGNVCNCFVAHLASSWHLQLISYPPVGSSTRGISTYMAHTKGVVSLSHPQPLKERILFTRDLCHPGKL